MAHAMRQVGKAWIADSAVVVGKVTLGEQASVWPFCAVRGDVASIRIGSRVNVQDGTVLHCKHDVPLEIAHDVAIGHAAVVHGRSIGPRSLIATRATILDDCQVGEDCLIAAGAVLTPGTEVPPGSVVMGIPGTVVRPIRPQERDYIARVVATYIDLARRHADGEFHPLPSG